MNNLEILMDGLKKLNIEVNEEKLNKLLNFKEIMLRWNENINLTSITDEKEIFIKHYLDSATCLSTQIIKSGDKIIDVGTGAGFPGMVVKILKDDINLTLLDSLKKRTAYLEEVTNILSLKNIEIIHGRAEEYGQKKEYREMYDVALSRAVAPLNVVLEYCLPFVKEEGYFLCQKGPSYKEEAKEAEKALEVLGGKFEKVEEYSLPYSDIKHYVIVIKKIKSTPTKYPRKPGKPSANPIK